MENVRPPAVAGAFYPAHPDALRSEVLRHLDAAREHTPSAAAPKMLIVPHAGYVYSGATAARGYALLAPHAERIRRVVLMGPVHRVPVMGMAAPTVAAFHTPLGAVKIDQAGLAALKPLPHVIFDDRPHAPEHSLEVQLPFLQAVLGNDFSLLPLAVGNASPQQVASVIDTLWGAEETVFIISTDLSHYHSYDHAQQLDHSTAARIQSFATDIHPHQACGALVVNGALLAAQRRGLSNTLLHICNSGDTVGDKNRVVGYATFALTAPPQAPPTDDIGEALLLRARNAIARRIGLPMAAEPAHPALGEHGATFVTLHDAHHRLRGCIGRLQAFEDLDADIRHNAENAAFRDPRFPPVKIEEWPQLQLEISVLEPAEPLPAAANQALALQHIQPGIHGVIFEWGAHRATFLPQVWEQLPRPEDFMAALKRKAGLPPDFWALDVKLARYRVTQHDGGPIAKLGEPAPETPL